MVDKIISLNIALRSCLSQVNLFECGWKFLPKYIAIIQNILTRVAVKHNVYIIDLSIIKIGASIITSKSMKINRMIVSAMALSAEK